MHDEAPAEDLRAHERRTHGPGRRDADEERELIARTVREELRAMRRRWFVVWILTLALSVVAWKLASDANDTAQDAANTAQRTANAAVTQAEEARAAAKVQCVRSKRFLPYFTEVLLTGSTITRHPDDLRDYRTLLPKSC